MTSPTMLLALALASLCLLGACGEKAQTATTRKVDDKVTSAGQSAFMAKDFKAGDQANWDQQTRQRTQGQNEYSRVSAKPK